jgi:hypothetical protein
MLKTQERIARLETELAELQAYIETIAKPQQPAERRVLATVELFRDEEVVPFLKRIAEAGKQRVDSILTRAGYGRTDRLVWDLAFQVYYPEFPLTERQHQAVRAKLNKEKYAPVKAALSAAQPEHGNQHR